MGNLRILCACLPLAAACGGGDMTALGGIYTIDSWTENQDNCDSDGEPSVFQSDTALYIKSESIFGTDFVSVVTCADIAECEAQLADDDIDLGAFFFEQGSDEEGWTESSAFAFENLDGMCEATGNTDVMTSPAEGMIRIETRTVNSAPYPATGPSDDRCPEEGADAAVEGLPCEQLEVVTATFAQGL
jgi:hypothetical protein